MKKFKEIMNMIYSLVIIGVLFFLIYLLIKNTYRTLLTRGQKGCYIYCEDKQLSEYLKRRVNRCNEITYSNDDEEDKNTMMVAEEGEEYKYE